MMDRGESNDKIGIGSITFQDETGMGLKWRRLLSLRICSLFSGAGGLDLGFIKAGHKVVWANDIDRDSVDTYRKNIGDHIVCEDVAELNPKDIPEFDVLIGGFPCQGFSRANVHRTKNDQRNKLYEQIVRFLKARKPSFFVLENVRGILSMHGGKVFSQILIELSQVGYSVSYKVVNAADYGVPQRRIRVFIVGIRNDKIDFCRYEFPNATHFGPKSEGRKSWKTIGQALTGIPEPDTPHKLKNHVCSKYKITNRDFTGHRRTDPDKPSPTILARGDGGGGVCALQHPNNHRRLSVRESALVQTFPKGFVFKGALNSMYRQIGNAVPILLATQIGKGFRTLCE